MLPNEPDHDKICVMVLVNHVYSHKTCAHIHSGQSMLSWGFFLSLQASAIIWIECKWLDQTADVYIVYTSHMP